MPATQPLPDPPTKEQYHKRLITLLSGYAPATYPCGKCKWPVISGYCCGMCGDNNPSVK